MMLKRNIKIILVGLFTLLFLGLVYSLFSSKPEIISDTSLRVEEPIIPGIESQVERAANANNPQSIEASESQLKASLESNPGDQSVATTPQSVVSQDIQASNDEADKLSVADVITQESDRSAAITNKTIVDDKAQSAGLSSMVSPFRDGHISQIDQAAIDGKKVAAADGFIVFDQDESSAVAKESGLESSQQNKSDFIDLNLSEAQLSASEVKLLAADQLVVDDLNLGLAKFKEIIPVSDVADVGKESDVVSNLAMKPESEIDNDNDAQESKVAAVKPSVFTLSEADQELMQGNSEISEQYRQTMTKLISIKAKLRDADQENVELRTQFETAVTQNLQLAQIIRDIDTKIKSLTSTN